MAMETLVLATTLCLPLRPTFSLIKKPYHFSALSLTLKCPFLSTTPLLLPQASPSSFNPLPSLLAFSSYREPLDLSEDNVHQVLLDARNELLQVFDTSVGITGVAELAELDGPFVKLRLKGRFWHQRSMVLARLANYLQQRIPEILEVDIEDQAQLDDSPANF